MTADFWSWSLAVYRREGVEAALLELQDKYDLNINILLWCLWCGGEFAELPDIAIRKAADLSEQWTREVTGPLRAARRALKTPPRQVDAAAASGLRNAIKAIELEAEHLDQDMLDALARDILAPADQAGADARRRRNVVRYVTLTDAARRPGFSMLPVDALLSRFAAHEDDALSQA